MRTKETSLNGWLFVLNWDITQIQRLLSLNSQVLRFNVILLMVSFCVVAQSGKKKISKEDSLAAVKYFNEGLSFYEKDDFENAINALNNAIHINPNVFYYFKCRAMSHGLLHQFPEALKDFTVAIEINRKDLQLFRLRAKILMELDMYDSAAIDCTFLIQVSKNITDEYFDRATCYRRTSKYEAAMADIQVAMNLEPNKIELFYERGMINYGLKQYPNAIEDFSKYLSNNLDGKSDLFRSVMYHRGVSYLFSNNFIEGIKDLEKIPEDKADAVVHYYLGIAYREMKDTVHSRYEHEISLKLSPENSDCYFNYAMSEYIFGDCEKANDFMSKCKMLLKDKPDAGFFRGSAKIQACLKDTAAALGYFDKAIFADSMNIQNYTDRVRIFQSNPKYGAMVLSDLIKIEALYPDTQERALLLHAIILEKMSLKDTTGIERDMQLLLRYSGNKAILFYNRALYYYFFNDSMLYNDRIIELLSDAIKLQKNWEFYKLLSVAYLLLKEDREIACRVLHNAHELLPNIPRDEFRKLSSMICRKWRSKSIRDFQFSCNYILPDEIKLDQSPLLHYIFENKMPQMRHGNTKL